MRSGVEFRHAAADVAEGPVAPTREGAAPGRSHVTMPLTAGSSYSVTSPASGGPSLLTPPISVRRCCRPYVRAKQAQLIEKDPNKAVTLFWAAINSGELIESALKETATVLKQADRAAEVIEAIRSF